MENVYYADERYFNFLEYQVKELNVQKNQIILVSMFQTLTGSRHRTRRRPFMDILPMLITSESTSVSNLEIVNAATPPGSSEAKEIESALEQLVPVSVVEAHTQPSVNNQLGGSYITEALVRQIENVSCHTSLSSLDSVTHEYVKNHFNKLLSNKVYNTFKELFGNINR